MRRQIGIDAVPAYSGKFVYCDERGSALAQGPCQLGFDTETVTITPVPGTALVFDLGDVDRLISGDWDLQCALYTGRILTLQQFGKAFGEMRDGLAHAWCERTVRCLLLEDLEEVARFNGTVAQGTSDAVAAEIRLYKSNLAILPAAGTPFQWRLAQVDSTAFDQAAYTVLLQSGVDRIVIGKLAKKTDEFIARLQETLTALRARTAEALHRMLPFLDADRLQQLVRLMPEGRSVRLAALADIDPRLPEAMVARAVDARLKPYCDALRAQSVDHSLFVGFKFIRKDELADLPDSAEADAQAQPGSDATGSDATGGDAAIQDKLSNEAGEENPTFTWLFFPLSNLGSSGYSNLIAWEASTGSGRATYFFRAVPSEKAEVLSDLERGAAVVESAIQSLTSGLSLVNFRREPIYLPDDSLEFQPRFRRYAIAARKLPDLRALRGTFLGRAIHSTPENWSSQVQAIRNASG
jgi:hypothetical protein